MEGPATQLQGELQHEPEFSANIQNRSLTLTELTPVEEYPKHHFF